MASSGLKENIVLNKTFVRNVVLFSEKYTTHMIPNRMRRIYAIKQIYILHADPNVMM